MKLKTKRRTGAVGIKVGMLSIWDKWSERHAVTVVLLDKCQVASIHPFYSIILTNSYKVVQVKTVEKNGYTALQLGISEKKAKRTTVTELGHFSKADVKPKRKLVEFNVSPDMLMSPGTQINAVHFVAGQLVDVSGLCLLHITNSSSYISNMHNFLKLQVREKVLLE